MQVGFPISLIIMIQKTARIEAVVVRGACNTHWTSRWFDPAPLAYQLDGSAQILYVQICIESSVRCKE